VLRRPRRLLAVARLLAVGHPVGWASARVLLAPLVELGQGLDDEVELARLLGRGARAHGVPQTVAVVADDLDGLDAVGVLADRDGVAAVADPPRCAARPRARPGRGRRSRRR